MQQLQQSDHPTGDGLKLEVNMYVPPFLLNNLITKSITDAHDNATRNISITSTNDKKAWKLIYQLMSLNGSMDSNQMLLLSLVEIKQKIISINTHNNASNHLNTSNVHHGGMNMSASIATASNGPPSIPQQLSASNIALNPNGAEYHGNVPLVHAQSNPIPISSYGAHQTTAKTVQLPNLNKAIGMVLTNLKELGCHHIVTIMQPFDRYTLHYCACFVLS